MLAPYRSHTQFHTRFILVSYRFHTSSCHCHPINAAAIALQAVTTKKQIVWVIRWFHTGFIPVSYPVSYRFHTGFILPRAIAIQCSCHSFLGCDGKVTNSVGDALVSYWLHTGSIPGFMPVSYQFHTASLFRL